MSESKEVTIRRPVAWLGDQGPRGPHSKRAVMFCLWLTRDFFDVDDGIWTVVVTNKAPRSLKNVLTVRVKPKSGYSSDLQYRSARGRWRTLPYILSDTRLDLGVSTGAEHNVTSDWALGQVHYAWFERNA